MNPKLISRTKWLVRVEAVVGVLTALLAASWFERSMWGAAVLLASGATVVLSAVQLARLARLDYSAPVLTLLRQLESLQRLRIRSTQLGFIIGSVLWLPFLVMLVGVPMRVVNPSWLVLNIVVSLAVMAPLAMWLGARSALRDDLTGRSLSKLRDAMAELAAFESE